MNGLLIYRSSAGSGKTFTLVKEYLKIVLKNPQEYRHILAITFTNKATGEMKSRIIEALASISAGEAENLSKILEEELILSATDIKQRAGIVLEKVLHDYSSFSISTIDSFFQKIIRSLSREMNLPLRYDVEINKDKVIEDITEKLLEDTGKDEELTQWLNKYIIYRLDDNKSLHIEEEIYSLAAELFREDFYESMMDKGKNGVSTEAFIRRMQEIKNSFEKEMKNMGEKALSIISSAGLEIEDFQFGKSGVANYFKKISDTPSLKNYTPGSRVQVVLESGKGWATKASKQRESIENIGENELFPILSHAVNYYRENVKNYVSASEILKLFYVYGIVHKLKEKLNAYRRENKIILISDTESLLKKFISGSDTPFVFEKTGNTYHHFLLDEFQDTSDSQWNNILPLIKNSLSEGMFSMIVGDVKQSIYRWRGGNMELLLYKVKEALQEFSGMVFEENLTTNFRSKKQIVEFNNAFFLKAAEIISEAGVDEKLMQAYAPISLVQKLAEKNADGGYVNICFVGSEKDENGKISKGWKNFALEKTLEHIKLLESKNYALRDIAIMVRNNFEAIQISEYLTENNYSKIISPASLLLSRSSLVQLLIHTMKFILHPDDHIAGTYINYYYNKYLSLQPSVNLHEIFTSLKAKSEKEDSVFQFLPKVLLDELGVLMNMSLFDLSENLIRIFQIQKGKDAYLQRFQDLTLDFMASKSPHLADFIEWWDHDMNEENSAVIVPENENAITIITIHKAKGLQYPVVIMPFLDWELSPKTGQVMWFSSEEESFDEFPMYPLQSGKILSETFFAEDYKKEVSRHYLDNLNLMYVAFTRPENVFLAICPSGTGETKLSSVVLRSLEESWPENIVEDDLGKLSFTLGELEDLPKPEKNEIKDEDSFSNIYIPWQERLSIKCNHARIWNANENKDGIKEKINYGLLMHEILASIKLIDDVPKALEKLFFEGIVSKDEKISLQKRIEELLSLPEIGKWFQTGWEVRTETEIMLPGSGSIRPDRVLIQDKKAVVIDYKTGRPKNEDELQLRKYADALSDMGYEEVEKYIIYIAEKSIVFLN